MGDLYVSNRFIAFLEKARETVMLSIKVAAVRYIKNDDSSMDPACAGSREIHM